MNPYFGDFQRDHNDIIEEMNTIQNYDITPTVLKNIEQLKKDRDKAYSDYMILADDYNDLCSMYKKVENENKQLMEKVKHIEENGGSCNNLEDLSKLKHRVMEELKKTDSDIFKAWFCRIMQDCLYGSSRMPDDRYIYPHMYEVLDHAQKIVKDDFDGITHEKAIDFLQKEGWLQEHDRILTALKEDM